MNAAEKHPQRQEIIDAILAGESLRKVAQRLVPPVHHTTLARFKFKILQPALGGFRGSTPKYDAIKDLAIASGLRQSLDSPGDAYQNALRQRVQQAVDKRLARRETWIEEAAKRPIVDKEGNVFNDMDHRALSAHDRNEGTDLEFLSRLGGLLQDGAVGSGGINIAIHIMPGQAQEQPTCVIVEPSVTRR